MSCIKNVSLTLVALSISLSVAALPTTMPANLMQTIKDYAQQAKEHMGEMSHLKEVATQAKEFYEENILKAQQAAVGNAVTEGRKDQSQQQLQMMKEMAPLASGCETSTLSKSIELSVCGQQEEKYEREKEREIKLNTKRALMIATDGETNTLEKTAALAKLQQESIDELGKVLEKGAGLEFGESYKDGVVSPDGVKPIDYSEFIMNMEGFDHDKIDEANAVVDTIAPMHLGSSIAEGDRMAALKASRRDSFLTSANSTLHEAVNFKARSAEGVSQADAMGKRLLRMDHKPGGFIKLINESPSITVIMRQHLILMGQTADFSVRKFETNLKMEALLAQRILNALEPASEQDKLRRKRG